METALAVGDNSLPGKVATWLGQQGYPLEMRVLRALLSHNVQATPSWYYTDLESGQQRETDLLVTVRTSAEEGDPASVQTRAVIECKSGDKPWVILSAPGGQHGVTARRAQRFHTLDRDVMSRIAHDPSIVAPLLDGYQPFGHALVRALANGNNDQAFAAMMATVKASAGVENWMARSAEGARQGPPPRCVIFPVLVVDAPLFLASLDDQGEIDVTEVHSGTVLWRYQLSPKHPVSSIITVLTVEAIDKFAQDMMLTTDGMRESLLRQIVADNS